MPTSEPDERIRIRRKPRRGFYDRETIDAILDEALVCHVGFAIDDQVYVTPTIHARVEDTLYFHGSPTNRTLNTLSSSVSSCVTATLIDGIVLGRSARKHSLNYRSAMVFGEAREVSDVDEKRVALRAIIEHMVTGRADDVPPPPLSDLESTFVLALSIEEASAKVRSGDPSDPDETHELDVWAGQLPLKSVKGAPIPDSFLRDDIPIPTYLSTRHR
jgi:uncharacterized protein